MAGSDDVLRIQRHKYDDPITKDTKQPDKVLFDQAINDIEHSRYEIARITLNTLDQHLRSERIPGQGEAGDRRQLVSRRAARRIWLRPRPSTRTSSCSIRPWKKPPSPSKRSARFTTSRWTNRTAIPIRPCAPKTNAGSLIVQFPNSKYVAETQQLLRNIQESLAEGEYLVGSFLLQARRQFRCGQPV